MKYFLMIALLCASFVSFSQVDTRIIKSCGYSDDNDALNGYLMSHYTMIMPDEHEVTNSSSIYWDTSKQSYCFKYTVYCTDPLSKEQKASKPIVQEIGCKTELPLIVAK